MPFHTMLWPCFAESIGVEIYYRSFCISQERFRSRNTGRVLGSDGGRAPDSVDALQPETHHVIDLDPYFD